MDSELCPPVLQSELAVHLSFNQKIIEHAIPNWETSHINLKNQGMTGPYYYNDTVYSGFGL